MQKLRLFLKKAFTPITIMLVPHGNVRPFSLKVPSIGIVFSVIMWVIGTVYVFSVAIDAIEYHRMKASLDYYSGQFTELRSTITSLKHAEMEFRKLFSVKDKQKVIENVDTSDNGSIDMEALKSQIKTTMESVGEIKDYLRQQKNIYLSTPMGWPTSGNITSDYGSRIHPTSGKDDFHSGIDIAADPGTPVRATADGIVSFSDWSGGSGNLVAIEHGFGYSTYYAHNKLLNVRVGQKVKRGDVIGYVGSTGNSTGPHVHYEVWQDGKILNPSKFLNRRS
ncbi:MAG: M23 family metallopeptidase [Thermodesulfovibrionales bacterium]